MLLSYLSYRRIYNIYFIVFVGFFGLILLLIGHYSIRDLTKCVCNNEWQKLFGIFRETRHDFQNNLQIIYGMIQLEKYDLVLKYIMDIKRADESISHICNISDKKLLCFLLEKVYLLKKRDIDTVVKITGDKTPNLTDEKYQEIEKTIFELGCAKNNKKLLIVIDDSTVQLYPNS